jgi:hypothetical protein
MLTLVLASALAVAPAPAVANPMMQCCQSSASSIQAQAAPNQDCGMPSMSGRKADQPSQLRQYSNDGRR